LIMVALFQALTSQAGLSGHVAWRASYAIVPVPALISVAVLTLLFGTDHPAGKWSDRHRPLIEAGLESTSIIDMEKKTGDDQEKGDMGVTVTVEPTLETGVTSEVDIAVNRTLTLSIARDVMLNPLTWLPTLAYLSTFGYELAIDSTLANILFALYASKSFGQTKSGDIASTYGLLNVITRPLGGYLGDVVYRKYGVPGKKYLTLLCGAIQGALSIALGFYIDSKKKPDLATVIGVICVLAVFNEMGNGANFSLVPHCNAYSNGLMSGLVGGSGNLGGIIFALIFRFQPLPHGKALWISGIVCVAVNVLLVFIRVPRR